MKEEKLKHSIKNGKFDRHAGRCSTVDHVPLTLLTSVRFYGGSTVTGERRKSYSFKYKLNPIGFWNK